MTMQVSVGLSSTDESNEFLRSLWAKMRAAFRGIGWQYLPRRDGARKFIRIGFASIPGQDEIQLGVKYKRRGVIDAVVLDKAPYAAHAPSAELSDQFKQCVLQAKNALGQTQWSHFLITITAPRLRHNVALYECENFQIKPIKPSWASLALNVAAYDQADAGFIFRCKLRGMLDLLSSWTNLAWIEQKLENKSEVVVDMKSNAFWADNEWLEDVPLINGYLCLTRDQIEFMDGFAGDQISYDDDLVRAAHHFHKALRLAHLGSEEDYDLATAVLMSALEVVSLDHAQKQRCDACAQVIHGISQRITQIAHDTVGPGLERFFKSYYYHRSRYLHEGLLQSQWPWGQPLIDLTAENDCSLPMDTTYPHNLLEFTGFILRRTCFSRSEADTAAGHAPVTPSS